MIYDMKRTLFPVVIIGLSFLAGGCASAPKAEESRSGETVWDLLAQGKSSEAKALYLGKADVGERDKQGRTTLHIAAEMNDADLAIFLIALGAELDAHDNQGSTPLALAVSSGSAEAAAVIAAAGADIYQPLSSGSSKTVALAALENGDMTRSVITEKNVNSVGPGGRTPLHLAAMIGAYGTIDALIAKGAEINRKDHAGKTALDVAFEKTGSLDHAYTAEKLILAGASSDHPFFAALAPPVRTGNCNVRLADGSAVYHFAAAEGYSGYVEWLILKKADVNIKNSSGSTPLHEAARAGHLDVMEQLIAAGAGVNLQDAKGNTPMHLAIPPARHKNSVALLLSRNANPNLRDEHGEIPLQVAITLDRDPAVIESLLAGGSDVSNRNIDGKTALYLAVEEGRDRLVPLLLSWHSNIFAADNTVMTPAEKAIRENRTSLASLITEDTVQQSDSMGNTFLHIAVRNRADRSVINRILDRKAAVNARNKEGNTALHLAAMNNDEDAGELLIARGADIFAPNAAGESPLFLAFHAPGSLREWMLNEKTLEARDGLGNTALHYAAQWKLAQHIPLMAARGARLEAVNATGETSLFWAARADSPETVNALVKQGALVNARDSLGGTALHSAVRWNAQKSAPALIQAGININSQNLNGKSPLHEAARLGLSTMEDSLLSRGAGLEVRDSQGNTPLMETVMAGFPSAAEQLVNKGADPIARNNRGDTPLHIAVAMQRIDLVTLLLNCGAPIHARNSQGITPFTTALTISPFMASTLLTKDRLYVQDDDGSSPLHIAVSQRAAPVILQAIINRGCRISAIDREGRTALRLALDMDLFREAKILADAGSDVFAPANDGKTPAEIAITKGPAAVEAIFSGKAIAARDSSENTVLHYAAKSGNADVIKRLIALGADRNVRNIASETPAEIARRWNRGGAAGLLQ